MTRSGKPGIPTQISIDECDIGTEHIKGSVPAGAAEAEAAKEDFYTMFVERVTALKPVTCMPDYGVHVYPVGRRQCVCKDLVRSNERVHAEIKELP